MFRVPMFGVLDHLISCELVECIRRGLKTPRRSTAVYIKRLPLQGLDAELEIDHRVIFAEKLEEFADKYPELTLEKYMQQSMSIVLDASGKATDDLFAMFAFPEYQSIDISVLGRAGKEIKIGGKLLVSMRSKCL